MTDERGPHDEHLGPDDGPPMRLLPKHERMPRFLRQARVTLGLSLILGVGIGFVVENHTNAIAEGKAATAEGCLKAFPGNDHITAAIKDCLHDGVPGGRSIGKNVFKVGEPTAFIEEYEAVQRHEASSIELDRLVIWSTVPAATAIGVATAALYFL